MSFLSSVIDQIAYVTNSEKWTLEYGRRVDEEELQQALSAAVTCTILAAAGPQRSRVLATLYKVWLQMCSNETQFCRAVEIVATCFVLGCNVALLDIINI